MACAKVSRPVVELNNNLKRQNPYTGHPIQSNTPPRPARAVSGSACLYQSCHSLPYQPSSSLHFSCPHTILTTTCRPLPAPASLIHTTDQPLATVQSTFTVRQRPPPCDTLVRRRTRHPLPRSSQFHRTLTPSQTGPPATDLAAETQTR